MSSGHRPKEFLNWSDTERNVATVGALRFEAWKIEQLGKMLGGK